MISDNLTQKIILCCILAKRLFRNSVTVATAKVPGDQNLFQIVCYILNLTASCIKKPLEGGKFPSPEQNRFEEKR